MSDNTLWSRRLLRDQGWTDAALNSAVAAGRLVRVRRGTYSPPGELKWLAEHRRLITATLPELLPGSVVSHASAAVLHGLPVREAWLDRVHVTRPGTAHAHARAHGITQLSRAPLQPADVDEVQGVPVTSLGRTAVDLARTQEFAWGVIVCDAALRRGASHAALQSCIEAGRRWSGNGRARSCVDFADGRSESPLESLSRVQLHRFALPRPQLQFEVVDSGLWLARCDFAWPEFGVVGECDGKVKYGADANQGMSAADVVMAEKRREATIREAGWSVVRWGWAEASDGITLANRVGRELERHGLGGLKRWA